jgi:hypothetical protein
VVCGSKAYGKEQEESSPDRFSNRDAARSGGRARTGGPDPDPEAQTPPAEAGEKEEKEGGDGREILRKKGAEVFTEQEEKENEKERSAQVTIVLVFGRAAESALSTAAAFRQN